MTCILTQYFSGDKIEKKEMGGHVARVGERRGVYVVFVGETRGKETTWATQE